MPNTKKDFLHTHPELEKKHKLDLSGHVVVDSKDLFEFHNRKPKSNRFLRKNHDLSDRRHLRKDGFVVVSERELLEAREILQGTDNLTSELQVGDFVLVLDRIPWAGAVSEIDIKEIPAHNEAGDGHDEFESYLIKAPFSSGTAYHIRDELIKGHIIKKVDVPPQKSDNLADAGGSLARGPAYDKP